MENRIKKKEKKAKTMTKKPNLFSIDNKSRGIHLLKPGYLTIENIYCLP